MIVDAERLNRFMNEPEWRASQYEEASDVLLTLENTLARALNTHITPVPWSETVTVLDSGLVNTSWHVHSVSNLDGTVIADGDALPSGWEVRNHWLRRLPSVPNSSAYSPPGLTLGALGGYGSDLSGRAEGRGRVYVSYMAGLGPLPELRGLILKKAKAFMQNRFDENRTARALDTDDLPEEGEEEFTESELAALGNLRNVLAWK